LDVGSDAAGGDPHVVETETLSASVPYAALSHMWGDVNVSPPLQTIRYNYGEVKQSIPIRRLPRNFRDAVETCRRLGIQYVWIDSLCILQDSTEDWQKEALEMHRVYRNAEVTIIAYA